MKDILIISLVLSVLTGCGVWAGRRYERYQFHKYLPTAMDGLCVECNDIGEKDGYKKGLQTCDDLVDAENNRGRR